MFVLFFVCLLFVYVCRLPWPDHSRLRSENHTHTIYNIYESTLREYISNPHDHKTGLKFILYSILECIL